MKYKSYLQLRMYDPRENPTSGEFTAERSGCNYTILLNRWQSTTRPSTHMKTQQYNLTSHFGADDKLDNNEFVCLHAAKCEYIFRPHHRFT